jgi:hypothetical protein
MAGFVEVAWVAVDWEMEEREGRAMEEAKEVVHMVEMDDPGVPVVVGLGGWKGRGGMAGFVEVAWVAVDWEVEGTVEVEWAWEVKEEVKVERVEMEEAAQEVVALEAVAGAVAARARVESEEVA